jgi:ribonuclease PH
VQLNIQVIRDGGGLLAAALNATALALWDAGINAAAMLSAVAISVKEKDMQLGGKKRAALGEEGEDSATHDFLLDPVSEEETVAPTLTLAFSSTDPGVLLSVVERGAVPAQLYSQTNAIGRAACKHVLQFMRLSLERRQQAS